MITFKSGQFSTKDKAVIQSIVEDFVDLYGDAYITKNNLRLFIKENINLLFEGLEKGDKIIFEENSGLIFVCGFSDKATRKYIKILVNNEQNVDRLLKVLLWNIQNTELYCKIKKTNPIKDILKKNQFDFLAPRGKEVLLVRKTKGE